MFAARPSATSRHRWERDHFVDAQTIDLELVDRQPIDPPRGDRHSLDDQPADRQRPDREGADAHHGKRGGHTRKGDLRPGRKGTRSVGCSRHPLFVSTAARRFSGFCPQYTALAGSDANPQTDSSNRMTRCATKVIRRTSGHALATHPGVVVATRIGGAAEDVDESPGFHAQSVGTKPASVMRTSFLE